MSERPLRSILIVEDEPLLAMDVEASLDAAGFRVVGPAGTTSEALLLLRRERPDLALLDLNLGSEMSFALFDHLEKGGTPFIVLSGHSSNMIPERHRSRPFVQKPYHLPVLLRTIHDALNKPDVTPEQAAG